ncbi:MAG: phosphohydrolase [Bacteroidetes bacterium]|nr:MAG: phosphohydrolase [Bacteroidota bacterium]
MNPVDIIKKYYNPDSKIFKMLLQHSRNVTKMAVYIALNIKGLNPDIDFIKEAAMLHDIGIFMTNAASLGCYGKYPYICHGYLGRELLEETGLPKHALVCERHVGVGITVDDIKRQKLPLPLRNMEPVSIEEKIICYADKFFNKSKQHADKQKTIEEIEQGLSLFGHSNVIKFRLLTKLFKENGFHISPDCLS